MEQKLIRTVFDKKSFKDTVNSEFTELIQKPNETFFDINLATVNDFFILYDKLFYDIPKEGETSSHEYLYQTSKEYIGGDLTNEQIQALLEEITSLREENLKQREEIINMLLIKEKPQKIDSKISRITQEKVINTSPIKR